jgi:hypothetical protein
MDGGWISEGRSRPLGGKLVIHTGYMGQELAPKWAERNPNGATNSMRYTLQAILTVEERPCNHRSIAG